MKYKQTHLDKKEVGLFFVYGAKLRQGLNLRAGLTDCIQNRLKIFGVGGGEGDPFSAFRVGDAE